MPRLGATSRDTPRHDDLRARIAERARRLDDPAAFALDTYRFETDP